MFVILTFYSIANPTVNLTFTTTTNAITMMWIPPSFAPQTYQLRYYCHSLCTEDAPKSFTPFFSVTPTQYTIKGLSPGSYCVFNLFGRYGSNQHQLDNRSTITLSAGKV